MNVETWIAQSVRGGSTQGSQLAHMLRSQYPDWTPQQAGARNLRDFVERFVEGVTVIGRSGMDVIYGVVAQDGSSLHAPSAGDRGDVNLWRIWVSPNSPYALAVDPGSGDVIDVPRSTSASEGHVRLEPAPQDAHQEIAQGFARRFEAQHDALVGRIGTSDGWWRDWQRVVRSLGLEPAWHEYRSAELEERLRSTLGVLGLSGEAFDRALGVIVRDRSRRRSDSSSQQRAPTEHLDLQAILLDAIPKMDTSDLRQLKIPVGVLLDVIEQRKLP